MRWHLLIEEYGPEVIYMKSLDNATADVLLRLSLSGIQAKNDSTTFEESFLTDYTLAEHYGMDATDQEMMPTSYKILQKYQNEEKAYKTKLIPVC